MTETTRMVRELNARLEGTNARVQCGKLRYKNTPDMYLHAPFSSCLAIDLRKPDTPIVRFERSRWKNVEDVAGVIHELGHILFDELLCSARTPPNTGVWYRFVGSEDLWFGWEYCVAQDVGLPVEEWVGANKDYYISLQDGEPDDFGNFSPEEQHAIIRAQVNVARKLGIVQGFKPVYARKLLSRVDL